MTDQLGLTPRQLEVKNLLVEMCGEGYTPSYREIAERLDTSLSHVHRFITALERRGHLIRRPGVARTFKVIE